MSIAPLHAKMTITTHGFITTSSLRIILPTTMYSKYKIAAARLLCSIYSDEIACGKKEVSVSISVHDQNKALVVDTHVKWVGLRQRP